MTSVYARHLAGRFRPYRNLTADGQILTLCLSAQRGRKDCPGHRQETVNAQLSGSSTAVRWRPHPTTTGGMSTDAGVLIHVTIVIYLGLTAAVFALFGLIQKWVEKL